MKDTIVVDSWLKRDHHKILGSSYEQIGILLDDISEKIWDKAKLLAREHNPSEVVITPQHIILAYEQIVVLKNG